MKQFFVRRWFLLALAIVLAVGFTFAKQLHFVAADPVGPIIRKTIVGTVLFLMSLPLGFGTFYRSIRWRPAVLATAINYGLLPVGGWCLYFLVAPHIDEGLAIGILVTAATPSTLASAAVWTRRAGGNDTVAILVTIITNSTCFIVTPLWLYYMTDTEVHSLNVQSMIIKLLLLVVVPMAVAQVLRLYRPLGDWATSKKTSIGVCAQWGVLSMILLGCINAGESIQASTTQASSLFRDAAIMIAVVLTLHLSMLAVGHLLSYWSGMKREDRIAVGFSGSQKTLMVGLAVAVEDYAIFGLAVLPMVTFHVGQLLVDTIIADRLKKNEPPLKSDVV